MGLHDSFFSNHRSNPFNPLHSISNVFFFSLQEKAQREIIETQSSKTSKNLAFSIHTSRKISI